MVVLKKNLRRLKNTKVNKQPLKKTKLKDTNTHATFIRITKEQLVFFKEIKNKTGIAVSNQIKQMIQDKMDKK